MIGSEFPWLEAMLLEKGVNLVTTLEYSHIESQHPSITTITAKSLRKLYLDGEFSNDKKFDAAITFSSVEHSGLGRYFYSVNSKLAPISHHYDLNKHT